MLDPGLGQRRAAREAEIADSYYTRPEGVGEPVVLNIYDLHRVRTKDGRKYNAGMPQVGLGFYHSGLEVYGREVSFGFSPGGATGVFEVPPRCASGVMPRVTFKESIVMGYAFRSRYEVDHVLRRLAAKFRGDAYHIVARNCNHFANELSLCLVGRRIPSFVNRPANVGRRVLKFFQGPVKVVEKVVQGVQKAGQVRESRALRDAELPGGHRALPARPQHNAEYTF